jgi:hypothetical protein
VHHAGVLASFAAMVTGDVIRPIKATQFTTYV